MAASSYYDQLKGQIFNGKYVGIKRRRSKGEAKAVFEVYPQDNAGIIAIFEKIRKLVENQVSLPFNSN